jgi:hypothetical protein
MMVKRSRPKKSSGIDVSKLSKGMVRKLNALKKSLGDTIAESAFAQWLASQPAKGPAGDPNAAKLIELVKKNDIKIPRGGLVIRRGGPRIFVEPVPAVAKATRKVRRKKPGKAAVAAE